MKIINILNEILQDESYEGFSSIQDRYINADCESLAILLAEKDNFNGEIIKIRQLNKKVYNHFIYKKNNLFYDVNGEHSSIIELMKKISYFDTNKEFSINTKLSPI